MLSPWPGLCLGRRWQCSLPVCVRPRWLDSPCSSSPAFHLLPSVSWTLPRLPQLLLHSFIWEPGCWLSNLQEQTFLCETFFCLELGHVERPQPADLAQQGLSTLWALEGAAGWASEAFLNLVSPGGSHCGGLRGARGIRITPQPMSVEIASPPPPGPFGH